LILVLDASVVLKWFFRNREDEAHIDRAVAILKAVDANRFQLVQPPHSLAEVAAVLAREKPNYAQDDLLDLQRVEWRFVEDASIYETAIDLSIRLRHHVFDTLYHASALHTIGATLVTADRRYYRRARDIGQMVLLADFDVNP
jgi:predicted nucleic acid-binding protein